jgi:hypothetical protein
MNKLIFVGLGALFWLIGVLFIRFAGPLLLIEGSPLLLVPFAASFPASWVCIKAGEVAGKVKGHALLVACVIMNATALMLDGAALALFPSIYGVTGSVLVLAAAWLLWTFGTGLLVVLPIVRTGATAHG